MLNRRAFLCGTIGTALAAPLTAGAQPERIARIGILPLGPPSESLLDVFLHGLRDLGYVGGGNTASTHGGETDDPNGCRPWLRSWSGSSPT
jgi:hypothetical protein